MSKIVIVSPSPNHYLERSEIGQTKTSKTIGISYSRKSAAISLFLVLGKVSESIVKVFISINQLVLRCGRLLRDRGQKSNNRR